jgi:UDP-N-acetylmuramate dehydrogenase
MNVADQMTYRGELRLNEELASYTSWRVGGPADRLYKPADLQDLCDYLGQIPVDEPLTWIGLGSNLLIRDGGVRGTVIVLQGKLSELQRLQGKRVRIEAGVSCAKAARFCAREGLVGLEFLAGIPGTIGGALAMNAGAFGGETWERIVAVETVDHQGVLHRRSPEEYEIDYRRVKGPQTEWFVAAEFELERGDAEAALLRIKGLLEKRNATQPIGSPSCGSVFRNPEGDYSGRLIEAAGLKGFCIGGACVSEKHANFILNQDGARAADIEALILLVQEKVREQSGVSLIPEVRIIGEATS